MDIEHLSRKAVILYGYISGCGGGALDEWQLRDKTGLSHGSVCAARKELVEAGLLTLGKEGRKLIYQLTSPAKPAEVDQSDIDQSKTDDEAEPVPQEKPVPAVVPSPPIPKAAVINSMEQSAPAPQAVASAVGEADMPRVEGSFDSFDDWLSTLTMELGGCVNVSESLVSVGEYIVYAEDYGQEDHYRVTENEDGGVVVD